MKKKLSLYVAFALSVNALNANMQSYLNNTIIANYEEAGSYKGQIRGAYSLGGVKVKYGVSQSYNPIHLELPNIKMGCGGIDATFGGFSFMNEEYLVNLLKSIMSQAPAFLWQLALSTLDKDTQNIISELQKMAAAANSFNLNSCTASQKILDYSKSFFEDGVQNSLNSGSSDDSIAQRNKSSLAIMTDYINSANSFFNDTGKTKATLEKKVFLGSLLEKSFANNSSNNIFGNDPQGGYLLESIMRYMIGDIAGYKKGSNENFEFDIKLWGAATKPQIKEFIYGGDVGYIYLRANNDNYGEPNDFLGTTRFDGIKKIFEDNLKAIVQNMVTKQSLTTQQREFINSLPIPIYRFLNTTAVNNEDVTLLAEYVSIMETKALLDWIIESVANSVRREVAGDTKETQDKRIEVAKNCVTMKKSLDDEYSLMKKDFKSKVDLMTYYKSLEHDTTGTRKNLW